MDIGYKLKILSKNLETHLTQKLKKDGITSAQFHILVYLAGQEGKRVSQKEICDNLDLKHTTVIGLLKRMSEKGLVASETNAKNARYKDVFLTEKGWQCTAALEENRIYVNEKLLSGFFDADKVELHRLLLKLEKNIAALK